MVPCPNELQGVHVVLCCATLCAVNMLALTRLLPLTVTRDLRDLKSLSVLGTSASWGGACSGAVMLQLLSASPFSLSQDYRDPD